MFLILFCSCNFLCSRQFEQISIKPTSILVIVIIVLFIFLLLWKSSVDYPFTSNVKVFKRLCIIHLLNMLIEIMDHLPFIKVLTYIFFWPCPFQEKK